MRKKGRERETGKTAYREQMKSKFKPHSTWVTAPIASG